MLTRTIALLKRRRRAHRFGMPYTRDRDWKTPATLRINGGDTQLSLPHDRGTSIAVKDIFISDVYGLEGLKDPPRTIIDVGGHVGLFSLAARAYFPTATINAYEPNPVLWPYLEANAVTGGFLPILSAVGPRRAKARLQLGADSVFTQCVESSSGTIEVTPIREAIDRIAGAENLDLLKLDCEGAEWEIFQDTASLARVNRLTMEYHLTPSRSLAELEGLLREAGFSIEFMHEDGATNGRIWAAKR